MTVVKLTSKVLGKPLNAKQYIQLDENRDNRFPVGEDIEVTDEQLKLLEADDTISVKRVDEPKKKSNPAGQPPEGVTGTNS